MQDARPAAGRLRELPQRIDRDRDEEQRRGLSRMISDLIPVLDAFDGAPSKRLTTLRTKNTAKAGADL